ncbi:MAG: fliJ [Phenylobacterium sp.]|nr:fliJ [Phenylobacterium sp.]
MSWAQSLIKLSTYEVETLQKRLAEIADQRAAVEMRLAMLDAEGLAEQAAAALDPQNGWRVISYLDALGVRKDLVRTELHAIALEEQGARDALAQAFETQKKYEQVADQAQAVALKEAGRRENAQLDELGLRKAGRR